MPSASRSAAVIFRASIATSILAHQSATTRNPVWPGNASFTTRRTPHTWSCRSFHRREIGDSTASGSRCISGKRAVQERQPIFGQCVLRLGERAPDRGGAGDGLVIGGEGFDDHGAVVPDLVQSGGDAPPGDVVGPRSTPIVAAGVEMGELVANEADGRGLV